MFRYIENSKVPTLMFFFDVQIDILFNDLQMLNANWYSWMYARKKWNNSKTQLFKNSREASKGALQSNLLYFTVFMFRVVGHKNVHVKRINLTNILVFELKMYFLMSEKYGYLETLRIITSRVVWFPVLLLHASTQTGM